MSLDTTRYEVNTESFDRCCIISELIKIARNAGARLPAYKTYHIVNTEISKLLEYSDGKPETRQKMHDAFSAITHIWGQPKDIDQSREFYQQELAAVTAMQYNCNDCVEIPPLVQSSAGDYMTVKFVYNGMYYQYTASSHAPGYYIDENDNNCEIDNETVFVFDYFRNLIKVPVHPDGTIDMPEAGIGVTFDTSTVMHWSFANIDTSEMSGTNYSPRIGAQARNDRQKAYELAAQKLWQMLLQAEPLTQTITPKL